jgi:uncharacterized protein (TIRG00374 family)
MSADAVSGCESRPSRPSRARRIINLVSALACLVFFGYLVRTSGVTFDLIRGFGWTGFSLLLLISGGVILLDTMAWYFAVRHVVRPRFWPLFGLRIAGDSLSNALPGGVVLGETYKAVKLREQTGLTLAHNTATLLTVKLGLALTQAVFVLTGLALCYVPLRDRSLELFGFEGAHYVCLALTLGMAALVFFPLTLMFSGRSFSSVAGWLKKLPSRPLRAWLDRRASGIACLDEAGRSVLAGNHGHLALVFLFLLLGWFLSALETWVLLDFLGFDATLRTALVIESVGSMFRLVFFMVPSGIGGQDASFLALFQVYGLPSAAGGVFVLVKRFKELVWVGLGFLLVLVLRRRSERPPAVEAAEPPALGGAPFLEPND